MSNHLEYSKNINQDEEPNCLMFVSTQWIKKSTKNKFYDVIIRKYVYIVPNTVNKNYSLINSRK